MPVSSIEALPTTRLYELWFEQKFAHDTFAIRAGQLAADTEFVTSKYTDVFINGTYGWPTITALNLPSGGPSPPLAAVGARLKAELNDNVTVLATGTLSFEATRIVSISPKLPVFRRHLVV